MVLDEQHPLERRAGPGWGAIKLLWAHWNCGDLEEEFEDEK